MLTIIFLLVGLLVVIGVVFLVLRSGTQSGRHGQSGEVPVRAQQQSVAKGASVRSSGGDD